MKKNRPILLIVIILVIISLILIIKHTGSTLNKRISNFAIEDTSSITKIFLSDKKNNSILLKRTSNGRWTLNDSYDANIDGVKMLLKSLNNLSVRAPVSKAAYNNVISRMSAIGVKVEIYQTSFRINFFNLIKLFPREKLEKTFYVGDDAPDRIGTYMLMQGSEEPFLVIIPSFRGFLSSRFIPDEDIWRDQTIFNLQLKQIKSVKIEYPSAPDSSFSVISKAEFQYALTTLNGDIDIKYDTLKLLSFLSSFQNIKYEALVNKMDKIKKDSILSSVPMNIITVTDYSGNVHSIKTFYKSPEYGEYFDDAVNQNVIYDRDRLYALINNDKDFALIQYYVFDKIFKTVNNFKPDN